MYAIVGASNLGPGAGPELAQRILSGLSQAPGFVTGTFTRSSDGTKGRSMVLFETREQAETALAEARSKLPADAPIEIESLDVFEVAAHQ